MKADTNAPVPEDGVAVSDLAPSPLTPEPEHPIRSTPSITPPSNLIIQRPRNRFPSPKIREQQQQLIESASPKGKLLKKRLINLKKQASPKLKAKLSCVTVPSKTPSASFFVPRRSCSSSAMSSARRQPRSGARSGPHDGGEETQVWRHIHSQLQQLRDAESRAKVLRDNIVELESKMKAKLTAGESKSNQ